MKKRRRKCSIMLVTLLMMLIIAACGKQNQPLPEVTPEPLADWKTKGFQVGEEVEVGQLLRTGNYQPWEHGGAGDDISHLSSGVCDNIFWFFGTIVDEDGGRVRGPKGEYLVELYDTESNEYSTVRFTPAQLGLTGEIGLLVDMDMTSTGEYMFRWAEYTMEEEHYRQVEDVLIFTNLTGENHQVDFYQVFAEQKLEDYRETILPLIPSAKCHTDNRGNVWLIHYELGVQRFCLFDREGTLLMEYKGNESQLFSEPFFTYDKELIIPIYDERQSCYEFFWVDVEGKQFVSRAKLKAQMPDIRQFYGMSENNVYYCALSSEELGVECIVCWNILTGKRTEVYDFTVVGYDTLLTAVDSDKMMLRMMRTKEGTFKDWVVPLTTQGQGPNEVTVASFLGGGDLLKTAVTTASMENPSAQYTYEDASTEEARTRILAQMSQGEGPDILCVSMTDFYMMVEKGMLQSMEGLISEETKQELLPGVLQMGTIENELFGITPAVAVETFAVSESLGTKEQWDLEEIIQLMEKGQLSGAIRSLYLLGDSTTVARFLLFGNLENSFLIDWQQGECHFEDERFIHFLELTNQDVMKQNEENLQETDLIYAYMSFEASLIDFFTKVETKRLQIIGYPGGNGASYLCEDGGMVVVNATCTDLEAVEFFLETLLGEEVQARNLVSLSVRKLKPEEHLVRDEAGVAWWMESKPILNYEDGTTPLHRAAEFLESCVPETRKFYDINIIINQEVEAMLAEGKNAAETAKIIDNRVQIYLDENS